MKELIALQKTLRVGKDQSPSNNRYKYRKVDDILKAVKEAGIENIYIILSDDLVELNNSVYTKSTATIHNSEMFVSASAYAKEGALPGQSDPQISGSCSTYARKKALEGLFALDDGNDPDGNPIPEKKKQAKAQPFNEYKEQKKPEMTARQKGTLKDQIVVLDGIGSESSNKAITAINTLLGHDYVSSEDAESMIKKVKLTIEKAQP